MAVVDDSVGTAAMPRDRQSTAAAMNWILDIIMCPDILKN
jgi:hypothetical protein